MQKTSLRFLSLMLIIFLWNRNNVSAQFTINESFKNSTTTGITLGGTATLTSGTVDPEGDGWLRLTPSNTYQAGYALVNQSFPSEMGVLIDFEYTAWCTSGTGIGADGFSFFLFDAANANAFNIGGYGGSLGYAPKDNMGGLSGGYFGIGLDEYGNYSNPTEGRTGGTGFVKNAAVLRGPAPSYAYISGTQVIPADTGAGDNGGIDYNTVTDTRPSQTNFYRRIQVSLQPNNGVYTITVKWKTSPSAPFTTLLGPVTMTTPPPATLKMGLAASTGSSRNNHEIRNLIITTPGNISVTKQAPAFISNNNGMANLNYDITVANQTSVRVSDILIEDLLPAGYTVDPATGITVEQYGDLTNTVSGIAINNGILSGTASLASNAEITLHLTGLMSNISNGQSIRNTVKVNSSSIVDQDLTNNFDTVYTVVQAPLPIRLLYFTASKNNENALLDWATSLEADNDYFEIERSTDGKNFEKIGIVKGAGNSSQTLKYNYVDENAAKMNVSKLFYRLNQVDVCGNNDYSGIRSIKMDAWESSKNMMAFPVPFTDRINIQIQNATEGETIVRLYDAKGVQVYQTKAHTTAGSNIIQASQLQYLPKGTYVLECVFDNEVRSMKVSKQ